MTRGADLFAILAFFLLRHSLRSHCVSFGPPCQTLSIAVSHHLTFPRVDSQWKFMLSLSARLSCNPSRPILRIFQLLNVNLCHVELLCLKNEDRVPDIYV